MTTLTAEKISTQSNPTEAIKMISRLSWDNKKAAKAFLDSDSTTFNLSGTRGDLSTYEVILTKGVDADGPYVMFYVTGHSRQYRVPVDIFSNACLWIW
jgi:hypothetical protein